MRAAMFDLAVTTQGPAYPPSEVMDPEGNFVVIGRIPRREGDGRIRSTWGRAIVGARSQLPPFGEIAPYDVLREIAPGADDGLVLHTLPLPLPCNNYPMLFAPEQKPDAHRVERPSLPFHRAHIPDLRPEDGRKVTAPITLGDWVKARGAMTIRTTPDRRAAEFVLELDGLIPDSLYTVMALREKDLSPRGPTRPGPLGVPNVCVADPRGHAVYRATMPDPFPVEGGEARNRIVNVIVLWMSSQTSHGGAIGLYGLGGDIHAQLKLRDPITGFETRS